MGKLADRIKGVLEGPPRPLGFRSGAVQARPPTMLLLASVGAGDTVAVADVMQAGAQGALVTVGPSTGAKALKDLATAAAGGIWGGVLEAGGKAEVQKLMDAGAHFVLFRSTGVAGDALDVEDFDKVLEVEEAWPDTLLRPVDRLPLEAALYRLPAGESLSIAQVLQCRRVIGLVGKPVLVALSPGTGPWVLTILRDAGVVGVVVPASAVTEFHDAIRDLPPVKKKKERMDATLPMGGRAVGQDHEEDDDDEDDE